MMAYELTYPEVGKTYEFCKLIDGTNHTLYGRLIALNTSNKTCVFEQLDNGINKEPTGSYYTDIKAVRGVYGDYPKMSEKPTQKLEETLYNKKTGKIIESGIR